MEWVLHPIVTAMAMEKMVIIATGGAVQTVAAMVMEKIEFLSTFRCCYRHVRTNPYCKYI